MEFSAIFTKAAQIAVVVLISRYLIVYLYLYFVTSIWPLIGWKGDQWECPMSCLGGHHLHMRWVTSHFLFVCFIRPPPLLMRFICPFSLTSPYVCAFCSSPLFIRFVVPPRLLGHLDTGTLGHLDSGIPRHWDTRTSDHGTWDTRTMGVVVVPTYRNCVVIFFYSVSCQ